MISYRKLAMRVLGHSPVSAVTTARRSTGKRAAALALTAALVVGMTLPAFAQDWFIENGDITISAGENGNNVTQGSTTKENDTDTVIKSNGSSTASSNTVTIHADEGKTVNVTLDNVTINVDEGYEHGYDPNAYKTAVSVTGSGDTNIELNGNNTLTSGYGHAGLEHNKTDDSGTLTIQDEKNDDGSAKGSASDTTGSLTAKGGFGGAGIGAGTLNDGQVTITGGTINATGNYGGAGIGGAGNRSNGTYYTGDGDVTITGGTITATGDSWGAGIGGGYGGDGNVEITGGEITATGGYYAAGIGGGAAVNYPDGSRFGADGNVIIKGDAVIKNAQGDYYGAGIGGGYYGDSDVEISGSAVIENAESERYGAGIGGGFLGNGNVTIKDNAKIDNATGGEQGAGIGGGIGAFGDVTIEGNVTIKNAQGGTGASGIGGGAQAEPDDNGTGSNQISIKSTAAGSPNITAKGGKASDAGLSGGAAIGSGSVYEDHNQKNAKSDIIIEGKVTIDATGGGDVAIGDNIEREKVFNGLAGGTTIKRTDSNGKDVTQPGDVVAEPEPEKPEPEKPEPEKPKPEEPEQPAQPTVTPTEGAEAPSTGSVEVERPVTVEGLYVTNVLGKQITHTCTQNGTTLTIRANGIVTSAHLTLGMVRTLKAQGVKTLVFTTLLSRSTTVSVDALLAAEPDAPDDAAVVWTHTGLRAALTRGGADHSALLK